MENKVEKSKAPLSKKFIFAKILAIFSGTLYSIIMVYFLINPLPYSHKTWAEYSLLEWAIGIFVYGAGPACIVAGFLNHKFPTASARVLVISGVGIIILLFALALVGVFIGIPLLIAGFLTLSAENDGFQANKWPKQTQTVKKITKSE